MNPTFRNPGLTRAQVIAMTGSKPTETQQEDRKPVTPKQKADFRRLVAMGLSQMAAADHLGIPRGSANWIAKGESQ